MKELKAMEDAYEALKELSPDELTRAWAWLKAKLNTDYKARADG